MREAYFAAVDDAIADAFYEREDVMVFGVEDEGVYGAVQALESVHLGRVVERFGVVLIGVPSFFVPKILCRNCDV